MNGEHHWLRQGSTLATEVREIYDRWAETYDATLRGWNYQAPTQAARMLREALPAEAVLLDAGCGTGLTGLALRGAGFTGAIDGIDLSPRSLVLARRHGVYRTLAAADLQEHALAARDDSYDGLLCVGVLTYVPDAEPVLREFTRVVRPGGRLLVTQRDDLFRERDFGALFRALDDVVSDVSITEPRSYLPDNPDFGDEIKVIFALLTVR